MHFLGSSPYAVLFGTSTQKRCSAVSMALVSCSDGEWSALTSLVTAKDQQIRLLALMSSHGHHGYHGR